MNSPLYTIARDYADAIERAEGCCILPNTVFLLGAAPMPPDAVIAGSYVSWRIDGVNVQAMTEPTGCDVEADTLLELVAAARDLAAVDGADWLLRHCVSTGRTQIHARGAAGVMLCLVPPSDAHLVVWSDTIHMSYEVDDDLVVTANCQQGATS